MHDTTMYARPTPARVGRHRMVSTRTRRPRPLLVLMWLLIAAAAGLVAAGGFSALAGVTGLARYLVLLALAALLAGSAAAVADERRRGVR